MGTWLVLGLTAPLHAQVSSASVSGIVVDVQGAAIPNAKVTLSDQDRATTRSLMASALGNFTFTPVSPSTYRLDIEAPGFKKLEKIGIIVYANDQLEVPDLKLSVGAVNETVTIQANSVELQTETAQRDTVLTGQQAVDLPIVDRGFLGLLQVIPGFAGGDRFSANVNGNRNDNMSIKLDGISNMDSGVNMCCATWVNLDTIQEFKVITNTMSADIGHSGGASVSVVTKGGTREIHGSGYGFLRNESLNANSWLNNYNKVRKPTYRYNTEGFTVGGPIFIPRYFNVNRQKLFFFASEENQNNLSGANLRTNTVATVAQRGGDFSQTVDGNGRPITIKDPLTGVPFAGNMVPASRISRDGQSFLNIMPLPNYGGDPTYNYVSALPTHNPDLIGTYRLDYNINEKWHAFGRYTSDVSTVDNPYGAGTFPGLVTQRTNRRGFGVALNVATVISPSLTNEFTMGASQNLIPQLVINAQAYSRSALGLTYTPLYPGAAQAGLGPQVSFGGVSNAPSLGTNQPQFADNTNFNWADNVAKVRNSHTFKAGFSIERDRKDQTNGNPVGNFSFGQDSANPLDSGFAFSNALLGNFDTYSQNDTQRVGKYRFTNFEWYAQDSWKVTKKLTVEAGIRFYIMQPIYDAKGQLGQFLPNLYDPKKAVRLYTRGVNPATGKVNAYDPITNTYLPPIYYGSIVPGSGDPLNGFALAGTNGVPRSIVDSRGVQYGPRLGIAYSANSKTVVRVGAGVFYDRIQGNPWYTSLSIPPSTRQATIYYGAINQLQNVGAAFFPPNPGNNGAGLAPDGHVPTVYNWNATVQRELPFHIVMDLAYVGNINRHLYELVNINATAFGSQWLPQNQDPTATPPSLDGTKALTANFYRPYIGIDRLNYGEWGGTANYNSLQSTVTRRMKGLTFTGAYTFSKALGTADSIYNAGAIPGQVRSANYGRLAYDRTHSLVFSYTYSLPKAVRGSNSFVNNFVTRTLLNDWQLSGISTFRSGAPGQVGFNITGGANTGQLFTGNPDYGPRVVITGNTSGDRSNLRFFNTGVFTLPVRGSTGNDSGIGYLNLPGQNSSDLTLFKNVPFTHNERRYIQFRLEAYNALNKTQWSGVNTTVTFASATSNVINNLPIGVAPAGSPNGGRFGFGADNAIRANSARIVQLAAKIYF